MNAGITTQMRNAAIRDIPGSCVCAWNYTPSQGGRYLRVRYFDACPWHTRPGVHEQKRKGVAA